MERRRGLVATEEANGGEEDECRECEPTRDLFSIGTIDKQSRGRGDSSFATGMSR